MSLVKSPEQPSARDTGNKDKIVDENDEPDELPPGWIIEYKTRKSGSATKVDRRYTDPVTGYIFRSLKDTQRYLKTGKLGRLAIKPKNNDHVDIDNKDERLHLASKRPPPEAKTHQTTQLAGIKADTPSRLLTEAKTCQITQLAGVAVQSLPLPPPQPEPKTRQAKCLSGVKDNAPPASPPQAKTRRATRQAGIKFDSPPPSPPDTRTSRQATRARLVNLATPKEADKKTEPETVTDKHDENADMDNSPIHNKEIEIGPATLLPPEDQAPPVDLEKQELPVVNPTVTNPIRQNLSINFSMKDLWTDPCIEFPVKTLTGAIPCGGLKKPENPSPPPLTVPLEELWTDPCIEFAVKTLTGAIPVGEDYYLQNQPATSRNTRAPHDFCQQQQQQQDLTFGNVGLKKSRLF